MLSNKMHNNVKNTTQRETTHMKEQAQYVLSKDELLTNVPRSFFVFFLCPPFVRKPAVRTQRQH